jgi:propionyl-CoA carboxylase alpha chain
VLAGLPSGWRNLPSAPQTASYDGVEVTYALRRDGLRATVAGVAVEGLRLWSCSPTLVDLTAGGVRRGYEVHLTGGTAYVDSPLGSTSHVEDERFPEPGSAVAAGSLTAPMPGTVLRVSTEVGAQVAAGAPLLVLEAMKMEHTVRAAAAGVVEQLLVEPGRQVEAGTVLIVVRGPDGG